MPARPATVARWLPLTMVGLSVAGLAVSAYLTVEHFTASTTLACPATRVVNCLTVTSSPQSTLLGVPLPILGMVFFASTLGLGLPRAWVSRSVAVRRGRLAAATLGVAFVFYLVYVELFVVDAICLWCTAIHALTVALFALVAWGTATSVEP